MTRFFLVHGINTPPDYSPAAAWGPIIEAAVPTAAFRDVRWPSTGTVAGDVAKVATSPAFVRRCRSHVATGLAELRARDWVIAHSMGTVWALDLMAERPELFAGVSVWLVGSPCSHPLMRPALRARGLLRPPSWPRQVPHWWNRDDRVCALSQHASHPAYTGPIQVAIPGRVVTEHPAEAYLAADVMQQALADAQPLAT